jgi:hypothetical protein
MPFYRLYNKPNRFSDVFYSPSKDKFYTQQYEPGCEGCDEIPWEDGGVYLLDDNNETVQISWDEWDNGGRDRNIDTNYLAELERLERLGIGEK